MSESTITRKSKYDLTRPAMLKIPAEMYYVLKRIAEPKGVHWSEVARDYITKQIKKVSE